MNSSEHTLVFSNFQWNLQPEINLKFAYFLINQAVNAAFCVGENEQFIYVNDATCQMTEYSREELLSMKHNENTAANLEYQEMNLLTKDGTERWLACAVVKLDGMLDFGEKPVELITGIDITNYKNVESDLNQALEQAKQLGKLRAQFLAMVCHQFRTPLNIVSFSNSLLKQQVDKQTQQKIQPLIEHIETAITQISQMLDDILLFAKAETAKITFEPQPLDLIQLCNNLVAQMHRSMSQKPINFVSQFDCLTACIDPKLLEPILKNLLENAIKYSPSSMMVDFILACENSQLIFQVKDQGIGIPLEDQQKLFEPFYRGSNIQNIPGNGLGLSIIKTFVDLHCGQVALESQLGVGTTFTVMLPLIKSEVLLP